MSRLDFLGRRTHQKWLAGLTALALLGVPGPAEAQGGGDKGKAALLAREAEDLLAEGKAAEACPKLDESFDLDPRSDTLLALAQCHEKVGKIGSAYREYELAESIATAEKKNDRAMKARLGKKNLFLQVPRMTVVVPDEVKKTEGLTITIDGEDLPTTEYDKPYPVDPGDVTIVASAPGKRWEKKVAVKKATRPTVVVGALAAVAAAPAAASEDPEEDEEPEEKDEPEEAEEEPKEEAKPAGGPRHEDERIVVDIGIFAAPFLGLVGQAELEEINGTQYNTTPGPTTSDILANCNTPIPPGAGECEATYDPALNIALGGQVFVGYGFTDSFQLGGRAFVAGGVPDTDMFLLAAGPSISGNVSGPWWLGVTILVGTHLYTASVTGARGSVGPDQQAINGGLEEVDIPKEDLASNPDEGLVEPGFMLGGAVEISYNITDWFPDSFMDGSLMFSTWPTLMAMGSGVTIALPVGIGYRFY